MASSLTPVTDQSHRRQPSAVQIRSRRMCHGVAAFLQLELFRVYTLYPSSRICVGCVYPPQSRTSVRSRGFVLLPP
ncbi:hypothetical protein FNI11_12005 [Salmonella enterica subsp. salamae]|nr:hypothetical protein [Salmonella enterica subsp. salamae]ECJ2283575.1 hypothetical protein [Salmonella enterica subsp. salamae]